MKNLDSGFAFETLCTGLYKNLSKISNSIFSRQNLHRTVRFYVEIHAIF